MLILSLNLQRRADSTCFVSCSGVLIFNSTEMKTSPSSAMFLVTHYINILATTITLFSKIAAAQAYVQPEKLLTF